MVEPVVRTRAWDDELSALFSSSDPSRHVVWDDLLTPDGLRALRQELLDSWAWHYRSQPGYVLCQALSAGSPGREVAEHLTEQLRRFDLELTYFERWAFLHQRPFEEFVHTDVGSYVLTVWLTSDRWDRTPDTSGLRLYSLARPPGLGNAREQTTRYFEAQRPQVAAYIRYRENRAVVFPASTFHAIGPCHFDGSSVSRMRCSMTVIYDSADHWQQQHRETE